MSGGSVSTENISREPTGMWQGVQTFRSVLWIVWCYLFAKGRRNVHDQCVTLWQAVLRAYNGSP